MHVFIDMDAENQTMPDTCEQENVMWEKLRELAKDALFLAVGYLWPC